MRKVRTKGAIRSSRCGIITLISFWIGRARRWSCKIRCLCLTRPRGAAAGSKTRSGLLTGIRTIAGIITQVANITSLIVSTLKSIAVRTKITKIITHLLTTLQRKSTKIIIKVFLTTTFLLRERSIATCPPLLIINWHSIIRIITKE